MMRKNLMMMITMMICKHLRKGVSNIEMRNAESARKLKRAISDIVNENNNSSRHELLKMLDKELSKMHKHIDTNLKYVSVTMYEKIAQQVDYFDNIM